MVRAYVHVCAAKTCYNTRKTHPDKEFFGFPSDLNLCKTWLKNCERTDISAETVCRSNGYYKLCADHFESKWFTDSSKRLLNRSINPVPTSFENNIESLRPLESQVTSREIDLPEIDDSSQDTDNFCHCVLDPTELLVKSNEGYSSISYNAVQITTTKDHLDASSISQALLSLSPETELQAIDELCRFCLNKIGENSVDIFSNTDKAIEIRDICKFILPKRVSEMTVCDGLPHWACGQCVCDLETCHKLLQQFTQVDDYLRAIAKFSLYVDLESTSAVAADEEYMDEDKVVNPIPKGSLIIPFDHFNNVMNEPVSYLTRMKRKGSPSKKNTIKENISQENMELEEKNIHEDIKTGKESPLPKLYQPVVTTTASDCMEVFTSSASSVNQLLSLATPGIDLFTSQNEMFKDKIELICNNILLLPPEKVAPESSPQYQNIINELPATNGKVSMLNCEDNVQLNKDTLFNTEIVKLNDDKNPGDSHGEENPGLNIFDNNDSEHYTVKFKCLECWEIFSSYSLLVEHVISSHQKEEKIWYNCQACSKAFNSTLLLAQHLKKESHYGKYRCLKCESSELFNSRDDLEKHLRVTHSFNCKFCEAQFMNAASVEIHTARKHNKLLLRTCKVCDKVFKTMAARQSHEHIQHREREMCWICGVFLNTCVSLKRHIQLHMQNEFVCDICGRPFYSQLYLDRHKVRHRPEYYEKKYKCNICFKGFISKDNLKKHTYSHTTVKPYTCEFCQMGFVEKCILLSHLRKREILNGICPQKKERVFDKERILKNRRLSFQCDVCGRKFYRKMNAERHRKFHFCTGNTEIVQTLLEESETHQCEICSKLLFSKISLQRHIGKQHTQDPKPIKCEFCEKTFSNVSMFYNHERIHTGEKPFKCSVCDMAFSRKKNLKRHVLVHTEDKPYICHVCGKAFKANANLVEHIKIHDKAHFCQYCDQRFGKLHNLRLHMKRTHPTIEEEGIQYPCNRCGERFLTAKRLGKHQKEVHSFEDVEYFYHEGDEVGFEGHHLQILSAEGEVISEVEVGGHQVISDDMDIDHFTYVSIPEDCNA